MGFSHALMISYRDAVILYHTGQKQTARSLMASLETENPGIGDAYENWADFQNDAVDSAERGLSVAVRFNTANPAHWG